jgi:5-methylcytosine-specific restriction protein A
MSIERILAFPLLDSVMGKRCLEVLAEAIVEANTYGANKWGVHIVSAHRDKIRLLVGNLVVLSIGRHRLWMALDRQGLEESQEQKNYLEQSQDWEWDTGLYTDAYPEFTQVPSKNGYYTPTNDLQLWLRVRELHFTFVRRTAEKYRQLNVRSQSKHSPDLLAYLRHALHRYVPDPVYGDDNLYMPEEIPQNATFVEGSRCSVVINAYERNPKAREACINRHGTCCVVCGFDFAKVYGDVGKGLIHIHHLKSLADIGEEYNVDPINDLCPVCPNCHAIIHRGNPPYTIEQVKRFLQDAKELANQRL